VQLLPVVLKIQIHTTTKATKRGLKGIPFLDEDATNVARADGLCSSSPRLIACGRLNALFLK
jgi:hypothetical protein